MEEQFKREYKRLNVDGASKKRWFVFYRKLCNYYNISRSIQLGIRGVELEKIIRACEDLLENGSSLYSATALNSTEKEKEKTESNSYTFNRNRISETKVMLNFSVLVDIDTFKQVMNFIYGRVPEETLPANHPILNPSDEINK